VDISALICVMMILDVHALLPDHIHLCDKQLS